MTEKVTPQILDSAFHPGYSIKLDNFEGPLDLLLYLIKKEKIDIYDIPIASITRQYLEYIQMLEILDLEVAGEFIIMAATLIRIKTKMLLPAPAEEETEDPRAQLVDGLLEYQKYQKAAQSLAIREKEQSQYYPRADFSPLQISQPGVELNPPTLFELLVTFKNLLDRQPQETYHRVDIPQVTVEEGIQHVLTYMQDREKLEFEELFCDIPLKIYMVVTFLAILELIRRGLLGFEQKYQFGPINLWKIRN